MMHKESKRRMPCASTTAVLGDIVSISKDNQNINIFNCNYIFQDYDDIVENKDLHLLNPLDIIKPIDKPDNLKKSILPEIVTTKPIIENNNIQRNYDGVNSVAKIKKKYEKENIHMIQNIVDKFEQYAINLRNNDKKANWLDFCDIAGPINRCTWDIIKRLNRKHYKHSNQYLKIDNNKYCLAGSCGGSIKVYKILEKNKKVIIEKNENAKSSPKQNSKAPFKVYRRVLKRGLLSSMNVSFKPGPLSRKPELNESSHNNALGKVELVKLPSLGLTIFPQIGVHLDPNICYLLKQIRNIDGYIDPLWAKFSANVVQSKEEYKAENSGFTFTIPFENNRSKVLMRKDLNVSDDNLRNNIFDNNQPSKIDLDSKMVNLENYESNDSVTTTVKNVLQDLINTICISEMQNIVQYDPQDNEFKVDEISEKVESKTLQLKPKNKGKHILELKKLNVTVINIDEETSNKGKNCIYDFCKMGCVCSSLKKNFFLNEHCGLPECMFDCKCDIDDNCLIDGYGNEKIGDISQSVVMNLQFQMNRNLSKEEQKFQRTVIMSKDQAIVLGAKKRGGRCSKRYDEDLYLSLDDNDEKLKKEAANSNVKVSLGRLDFLKNCEVWCMIHQLYRCFCNGTFLEGTPFTYSSEKRIENDIKDNTTEDSKLEKSNRNKDLIRPIKVITKEVNRVNNNIQENTNAKEVVTKKINSCNLVSKTVKVKVIENKLNDKSIKSDKLLDSRNVPVKNVKESIKNNAVKNAQENNAKNVKILKKGIVLKSLLPNSNSKLEKYNMDNKLSKQPVQFQWDENKIIEIVRNSLKPKSNGNIKVVKTINPPVEGEYHVISWFTLMGHYLLKKINILLTKKSPYNQFIIKGKPDLYLESECVHIDKADEELLKNYPPFVHDITHSQSNGSYIVLQGKTNYWQIKASFNTNDIVVQNCEKTDTTSQKENLNRIYISSLISKDSNKKVSNSDLGEKSENLNNLAGTIKVRKDLLSNSAAESSSNKSENISLPVKKYINKNIPSVNSEPSRWFVIYVGNEFDHIKIPSKSFLAFKNQIYKAIHLTNKHKCVNFVASPSNRFGNFGLYIVPGKGNAIYLGPYSKNENSNIEIVSKSLAHIDSQNIKKTWGLWLNHDYELISRLIEAAFQRTISLTNNAAQKVIEPNDISDSVDVKSNTNQILSRDCDNDLLNIYKLNLKKNAVDFNKQQSLLKNKVKEITTHINNLKRSNALTSENSKNISTDSSYNKLLNFKINDCNEEPYSKKQKLNSTSSEEHRQDDNKNIKVTIRKENSKNVEDDDIILITTEQEIVEISDSED